MTMSIDEQMRILLKGVESGSEISEIKEKLKKATEQGRPLKIKLGLDPSAPDIHLGHAVVLRKIRQMQDLGHQAVLIIGDFTGMIGDPTGKSKTRKQLTPEQVAENAKTYTDQIFKILDKEKTKVLFNSSWFNKMNFREVIELCAKSTVARILERDDFQKRYLAKQPIALHEFFYPLMQAYDSVVVHADIELGGTDQMFNILMGRNIQKDYGQDPQLTLFMPLLEGLDGVDKMSKSLGNYVGVNETANVMYEKVMKVPDSLIVKYFNLCTDLHPDQVAEIQNRLNHGENPRDIKMELAREITRLYHGQEAMVAAEEHFKTAFQQGVVPDDAPVLKVLTGENWDNGQVLLETMMQSGKFKSKGELRRLFMQGAVKVNDEKLTDLKLAPALTSDTVVQVGKGSFYKFQ